MSRRRLVIKVINFFLTLLFTVFLMMQTVKDNPDGIVKNAEGPMAELAGMVALPIIAVLVFCFTYLIFHIALTLFVHFTCDFIYFSLLAFAKTMLVLFIIVAAVVWGIAELISINDIVLYCVVAALVLFTVFDVVRTVRCIMNSFPSRRAQNVDDIVA